MTAELLIKFADAIAEAKGWAQELEDDDRLDGFLECLESAGRAASAFIEEYECFPEFPGLVALVQKVEAAHKSLWEMGLSDNPLFDAEANLDAIVAALRLEITAARKDFEAEREACPYDSEW